MLTFATDINTAAQDVTFRIYRLSEEECARLREGVPYVKVYPYNPKHLCPKLNGYGDIYVFCIYLRTNSDLCHLQHQLIGFYRITSQMKTRQVE
jgi:hypothetical protein